MDLIEQWLRAIETGGDLSPFVTEDLAQEEMPNRLFPKGRVNDIVAIRANYAKGREVIASQRYQIVSALESGDRVALELAWTGVLAVPFGAIAAGSELRARIAMFLELRGGRIARIRNYDCYEL